MRPTNAWGRVEFTNEEDRIGKPKDVFSRNPTGYPMWTEAMKAAIGPLRRADRKWSTTQPFLLWRLNSGEPYVRKVPVRFGGRGG
jgi:hypothetical protein